MVADYEPSEYERKLQQAYEAGLVGMPNDGYSLPATFPRAAKAGDAVSNICERCHKPIDDHQGLSTTGPKCEDMLR